MPAWTPADDRYETMPYRRVGRSGLKLPAVSLGLWHNFGGDTPRETGREICRTAFDLGITHFDLANNYGPPPGSAEEAFGDLLATDFKGLRDELVISSKAGWPMWDGPYGDWGSRKYLVASLDQSLARMGLDYVDIFYHHRPDPETPLEETCRALDFIVRSGRALYVGISSYRSAETRRVAEILEGLGTPLLIHQPRYSMIDRWIEEDGLKSTLAEIGAGLIAFSPLAQGLLTGRYLGGMAEGSRATQGKSLNPALVNPRTREKLTALNALAEARGQTLAQMALAWVLRGELSDGAVTSALIGASRPEQVADCAAAAANLGFSAVELAEIDRHADQDGAQSWANP